MKLSVWNRLHFLHIIKALSGFLLPDSGATSTIPLIPFSPLYREPIFSSWPKAVTAFSDKEKIFTNDLRQDFAKKTLANFPVSNYVQ